MNFSFLTPQPVSLGSLLIMFLIYFFPTMGMTHFKHAQKSHLEGQVLLYCSGVKLVVGSVDK